MKANHSCSKTIGTEEINNIEKKIECKRRFEEEVNAHGLKKCLIIEANPHELEQNTRVGKEFSKREEKKQAHFGN